VVEIAGPGIPDASSDDDHIFFVGALLFQRVMVPFVAKRSIAA